MDLNELFHAHQVAVMRAGAALDENGRDGHFAKVAEYADRIRELRASYAGGPSAERMARPDSIIYGTFDGSPLQPVPVAAGDGAEDEGGALEPSEAAVPATRKPAVLRHYHVGSTVYQDLDLAVAAHMRQLSGDAEIEGT